MNSTSCQARPEAFIQCTTSGCNFTLCKHRGTNRIRVQAYRAAGLTDMAYERTKAVYRRSTSLEKSVDRQAVAEWAGESAHGAKLSHAAPPEDAPGANAIKQT